MKNKYLRSFLIAGSLFLFACGGGGTDGGGNSAGQNSGGNNNSSGGGSSAGAPVPHWFVSSGLGRDSQLASLSCPTATLCFASGTNEILTSNDTGQSWTISYQDLTRPSGGLVYLSGISFPDPLNGIANLAGQNPLVTTGDGGNTWTATNTAFGTSFAFTDSKHGAASELNLLGLQYTTDGGITWPAATITVGGVSTPLANYFFTKPAFVPSNSGSSSVGYAGAYILDSTHMNFISVLLKTTDSGATWIDVPTPPGSQRFMVVTFTDSSHGWIGTFEGNVLATTDGGATWASHSIAIPVPILAISCVGSSNCWTVAGNTIQASLDGGATWTEQNAPDSTGFFTNYYDIHFADAMHGVVVGYRYQTVGGPGTDFAAYTTTGGF